MNLETGAGAAFAAPCIAPASARCGECLHNAAFSCGMGGCETCRILAALAQGETWPPEWSLSAAGAVACSRFEQG